MNEHRSPLYWSFSAGTWYDTQVRISVFFPLLILVLCYRFESPRLGLVFSALLFVSVLLHEFGHVVAARLTGGSGDEILVWPLGGLAFAHPDFSLSSRIMTPLSGPLVNLILCLVTLPAVLLDSPYVAEAFHPFQLPAVELADQFVSDLFVLLFCANWLLLLTNLIPVYPLDGGQVLYAILSHRLTHSVGKESYLRVGCLCAVVLLVAGLLVDNTWVLFLGTIILILNLQETYQLRSGETHEDSFMGYDFSQGYTSLERSVPEPTTKSTPGLLRRWSQKRREEKRRRQQQKKEQLEHQLDALLDKVHTSGIESLTDEEKRKLNRASALYRKHQNRSES